MVNKKKPNPKAELIPPPPQEIAPRPASLSPFYAQMQEAIVRKVTGDSVADMINAAIAKATETGDHKASIALATALGALAPPQQEPREALVQQAFITQLPQAPQLTMLDYRRQLVLVIEATGPATLRELAQAIRQSEDRTRDCLKHRWFDLTKDGWAITPEARSEVLETG